MSISNHPDKVIKEINSLLGKIGCNDEDLRSVAIEIANWALPPPKTWALLEAAQEFAQFPPGSNASNGYPYRISAREQNRWREKKLFCD